MSKFLVKKKHPLGKGEHLVPQPLTQFAGTKEREQKGHSSESCERHSAVRTIQHGAAAKLLHPVSSAHKDRQHQQLGGRGSTASLAQRSRDGLQRLCSTEKSSSAVM